MLVSIKFFGVSTQKVRTTLIIEKDLMKAIKLAAIEEEKNSDRNY
jgi:hypothetical protein